MKRLCVAIFLAAAPPALPVDLTWNRSAFAQAETSAREAFEAAKELGTPEAWNAFLVNFPSGFYADLARAYLKNLGEGSGGTAAAPAATPAPAGSRSAHAETPRVELGANADLNGVRLLPDDSPWYQDISKAPVDRNSARILARRQQAAAPDFGPVWEGVPIGIPYVVVPGTQKKVPVAFKYADESDPGPYPIPPDAPIEGGPNGDGDRHVLVLDRDNWILYELFNAFPERNGAWKADTGAVWDLKKNDSAPIAGPRPTPPAYRSCPGCCAMTKWSVHRRSRTRCASRSPSRAAPTCRPRAIGRAIPSTRTFPRWACACG